MTRRRHISETEAAEIFMANDGLCHICDQKIDGGREAWDVEHVIPLAMGGDEHRGSDNLKPAHKKCHAAKTAEDKGHIATSKRQQRRGMGIKKRSRQKFRGWRKFNGDLVWADK